MWCFWNSSYPFQLRIKTYKILSPFSITNLEHLLHLKDVDFENKINNRHEYHLAQRNSLLGFVFWHHFVLVKNFRAIKLGMVVNDLNSHIKGQGIRIWHHSRSLQKKSKCYKCTKKTMKVIQNFINKSLPQCTQNLQCLCNTCDEDISTRYVLQK
jgi:hypothetical protein